MRVIKSKWIRMRRDTHHGHCFKIKMGCCFKIKNCCGQVVVHYNDFVKIDWTVEQFSIYARFKRNYTDRQTDHETQVQNQVHFTLSDTYETSIFKRTDYFISPKNCFFINFKLNYIVVWKLTKQPTKIHCIAYCTFCTYATFWNSQQHNDALVK